MKNLMKSAALFVCTAAAGFAAISLPFRLFENLSQFEMRLVLAGEIALLAAVFSAVFLRRESCARKKPKNAKETERTLREPENGGSHGGGTDFDFAA